ncbi:MAG: M1 family aminopeptidase [Candidatus Eisenbacteria bacterium]
MSEIRCRCRTRTQWTLKDETPKFAPDRTCDVRHLRLDVAPDLPKHSIVATATLSLSATYGPFDHIHLDAVDLDLRSVRDSEGRDLEYTYLDDKLIVRFPKPVEESESIVIRYAKASPARGLYFWGPTKWAPKENWQMWSQGEDEEARHWIPCHDAPNEMMTTEMVVTVPAEYTVISNGALLSETVRGKKKVWHFLESVPHPSYLIALVVGVFSKLEDDCDGLPVEYYVEPGREEEGRRSFGKTPEMIRCFAELLQCPFPYEKYSQVAVRNFTFGGMENTSATTQSDTTLHDEVAALNFSSDSLVSHELAHQWFGDLLTCRHWAHAWLKEGFATYFECIWREHGESFAEFEKNLLDDADAYFAEPYRRSIVNHRFAYPSQLFDMHLYPKGGWVLHMLRRHVGDELFWKALRLYVRRHAAGTVETIDLMRAIEDATGRSLEGFFQQWLFSPGHPELEGSLKWDGKARVLAIHLEQKQKTDQGTPIFRIPIEVDALVGGETVHRVFEMTLREQTFYLSLEAEPTWAVLDPNARVLKTLDLDLPTKWMRAALVGRARDTRVFSRTQLVRQAAKDPSLSTVRMLGDVLSKDPFWSVQQEAAAALGKIRTPEARDELARGLELPSAKARRSVVTALGSFSDDETVALVAAKVRKGDPSYHVRMDALIAYGKVGGTAAVKRLERELASALKRRDWHDLVALGAALGLVEARSETSLEALLAFAKDPSRYWGARYQVFRAVADLGAARPHLAPRIAEAMAPHLDDHDLLIAYRLPRAYSDLGFTGAIPLLQAKADSARVEEQREACLRAVQSLSSVDGTRGRVDRLQAEIRRLEEDSRKLVARLERMEEQVGGANGDGRTGHASGGEKGRRTKSARGKVRETDRTKTDDKGRRKASGPKAAKKSTSTGRANMKVRVRR